MVLGQQTPSYDLGRDSGSMSNDCDTLIVASIGRPGCG